MIITSILVLGSWYDHLRYWYKIPQMSWDIKPGSLRFIQNGHNFWAGAPGLEARLVWFQDLD